MLGNHRKRLTRVQNASPNTDKFLRKVGYSPSVLIAVDKLKDFDGKSFKRHDVHFGYPLLSDGRKVKGFHYKKNDVPFDHTKAGRVYTGQFKTLVHGKVQGKYLIDVTPLFVELYAKFGRCALHDGAHVYDTKGKTRVCKWCGQKQKFKTKKVVKVVGEWINV